MRSGFSMRSHRSGRCGRSPAISGCWSAWAYRRSGDGDLRDRFGDRLSFLDEINGEDLHGNRACVPRVMHTRLILERVASLELLCRLPLVLQRHRAHETPEHLVCRLLLEKKKKKKIKMTR